jgi:hypothetical protein
MMNAFATQPAFTQPASQPVLRFIGSPEQLLVSGQQSGGEFQGPREPLAPPPAVRAFTPATAAPTEQIVRGARAVVATR